METVRDGDPAIHRMAWLTLDPAAARDASAMRSEAADTSKDHRTRERQNLRINQESHPTYKSLEELLL